VNRLAESLGRVGFGWWDEAVAHARWLAEVQHRRHRVVWDRRVGRWIVSPAIDRGPRLDIGEVCS
jgi:hypothetical protein